MAENIKVLCDREDLVNVADAVRAKTNTSAEMTLNEMATKIGTITGGNPVLQDKTVTPTTSQQIVTADSGYDGLDTVTVNAMPAATQATPSITVNASGLITASTAQTAGYVTAGTKSSTYQLAFQAAKTITPGTANQTAVSSGYYTGGAITVQGDSNLVAGNIKNGVSIFGVNGTYAGTNTADTSQEDGLVARTLTSYTNDRVTTIGSSAFKSYYTLTSVAFANCKTINSYAFQSCSSLSAISFPTCTIINDRAFSGCSRLQQARFPQVLSIGANAFHQCSALSTISFPMCTSVGMDAFGRCPKITTVNLPRCTLVMNNAFEMCDTLTSVQLPLCTELRTGAFHWCSALTSVSLPLCRKIPMTAFEGCTRLKSIILPVCSAIESRAFSSAGLTSITLKSTRVCYLEHSNAFSATGITSTRGSIFVPTSLVASYKAATNWTYFSNRIFGI